MTYYIYIFTDSKRELFNVGYSFDIKRTILLYSGLPMYINEPGYRKNILVWVGTVGNEDIAKVKMNKVMGMNKAQKEKLIQSINPDWVELKPGINFEI